MRNKLITFIISIFAFLIIPEYATASDAYVSAEGVFGQGYFRSRGSECFFITAGHVVEDASEIVLTTASRQQLTADVVTIYPGDVGLLKVNLLQGEKCPKSTWGDGAKLPSLLDLFKEGVIKTKLGDGSTLQTEAKIQSHDAIGYIRVASIDPKVDISQGFSGSPFFIADRAAGMLLSVKDGTGTVLRQDALNNMLALFFNSEVKEITSEKSDDNARIKVLALENETFTGKIAKDAVKDYLFKAEKNSPIELRIKAVKNVIYNVQILDENENILFKKFSLGGYNTTEAYSPSLTGKLILRLIGSSGSGKYHLTINQLTTDSNLSGQANVLSMGDELAGKIAKGAIANYTFLAEENSPIELRVNAVKNVIYTVQILDEDENILFKKFSLGGYDTTEAYTPSVTGKLILRLIGSSGHGKYSLRIDRL